MSNVLGGDRRSAAPAWVPTLVRKQFLADNENDLVSLAQILGHETWNTTSRHSQRTEPQLTEAMEQVGF